MIHSFELCIVDFWGLFTQYDCDINWFIKLMDSMRLSVIVAIVASERLHWYPAEPICCNKNRSRRRIMWTAL